MCDENKDRGLKKQEQLSTKTTRPAQAHMIKRQQTALTHKTIRVEAPPAATPIQNIWNKQKSQGYQLWKKLQKH